MEYEDLDYNLIFGNYSISLGKKINIEALIQKQKVEQKSNDEYIPSIHTPTRNNSEWDLPQGVLYAKDVVRTAGILLEAVSVQLGKAANEEALLNNLKTVLAISGREAALPLDAVLNNHAASIELTYQAQSIGRTITDWAQVFIKQKQASKTYGKGYLQNLKIRSRCDQYVWNKVVIDMLMGPSGGPNVMQLYNEYLHQMVLLRDMLIPFENWDVIPLELKDRKKQRGLRFIENSRNKFISQILMKKISHKAIVLFAQSLLSPELPSGGYGFQYHLGIILPSCFGASLEDAPKYLLRWHPVVVINKEKMPLVDPATFYYGYEDYYTAPRSELELKNSKLNDYEGHNVNDIFKASIVADSNEYGTTRLQMILSFETKEYSVDFGQIMRGYRYSYNPSQEEKSGVTMSQEIKPTIFEHRALDIIEQTGLASSRKGIHFIKTGGNIILILALLGKIYPDNIIIFNADNTQDFTLVIQSGKGFGAKFLIELKDSLDI